MKYQEAIALVNSQLSSFRNRNINNYSFASAVNDCVFGISGTYDEWAVKREKKNIFNKDGIYKIEYIVRKWRKGAKGVLGDPLWETVFKGNYEQVIEFLGGE